MPGKRSSFHHAITKASIVPSLTARTAAMTGDSVDRLRRGANNKLQWYRSAMLIVVTGEGGNQEHEFHIEESDDDSTWTRIAAKDLHGPNIVVGLGDNSTDNTSFEQGTVRQRRFIRVVTTVNAPAGLTGATYTATFLLDEVESPPVDRTDEE